jgi:hypothetical protein
MRVFRASLLVALSLLLGAPEPARAAGAGELGTLESGAVDTALKARGLVLDPAPEGKMVGFVHVVNLEVFQPSDGRLLEWLNHFHRTSRERHVRLESLLVPGMVYDPALVDETMRNLRNRTTYGAKDPTWSSIVAMVPVQAAAPGTVDVLIVTRDVWSLRLNSDYNYQPGYLITLNASLAENNFLGLRKQAAVEFIMRQGDMWLGPTYMDPNVLGTHLRLISAFYESWARKIGELAAGSHEGFSDWQRLEYPFYALTQPWGGFVDGSYTSSVERLVAGTGSTPAAVLTRFDPDRGECVTPGGPYDPGSTLTAECAYRSRVGKFNTGLTRSFPRPWLIQRVTVGNEIGLVRTSFLPEFPHDPDPAAPDLRASFARAYFRIAERTSNLYVQYDAFTPRYRTYRDLDSYDLGEDQRLGPSLTLKIGRASTWLGSEADFFVTRAEVQVNFGILGGFQNIGASWESRDYSDGLRDQLLKAQVYAATPILARSFRVVASGVAGFMADNVHRALVYVGGLEGVRGYPVNAFLGYDWYIAHLELRSMPLALASLRVGGLVFADAGNAATTAQALMLYGDAGAGLRLLIPQLNAEVLRCDWAFPFRSYGEVQAGWPGRISCGFRQVF